MGFEEYRVRLTSIAPEVGAMNNILRADPRLTAQHGAVDLHYQCALRDANHVVEIFLTSYGEIHVRFAICHPESVDEVFINLVKELAGKFRMNVLVPGGSGGESKFIPPEYAGLGEAVAKGLVPRRREWKAFSQDEAGISVEEAMKTFLTPRFLPKS